MPTHTPSPHRFLTRDPRLSQKPSPKPQSSLRHGVTAQAQKPTLSSSKGREHEEEASKATPAKRFIIAPTPSRSVCGGPTGEGGDEAWDSTQTLAQVTPLPKPKRRLERVESIEASSQNTASWPLENGYGDAEGVPQSIEHTQSFYDETGQAEDEERDEDPDAEMLFTPLQGSKRRRLSPPTSSSPTVPEIATSRMQPPQTPAPTSHRFLVPTPKFPAAFPRASTAASAQIATAAPTRPHFLVPRSPPPPSKSTPLPETFSPSRKGQRYVSGALASTVQSWILEVGSAAYGATNKDVVWAKEKEDGMKLRLRISDIKGNRTSRHEVGSDMAEIECFPGGMVFVRGVVEVGLYAASPMNKPIDRDDDTKVLLAGQGGARGNWGVKLKEGTVVGIRAPTWDVVAGDEKWTVGVDWMVL